MSTLDIQVGDWVRFRNDEYGVVKEVDNDYGTRRVWVLVSMGEQSDLFFVIGAEVHEVRRHAEKEEDGFTPYEHERPKSCATE